VVPVPGATTALAFFSVAVCAWRARTERRAFRPFWWAILIAGAAWPFSPTAASIAGAVAFLCFPFGAETKARRARSALDGCLAVSCLLFASWANVIGPDFNRSGAAALPGHTAGLAAVAVVLWAGTRARDGAVPLIGLVGLGTFLLTSDGHLLHTAALGHLAIALGAWWPGKPTVPDDIDQPPSIASIGLVYLPVAVAVATGARALLHHDPIGPFLTASAVAILLTLIARQLLAQLDNLALSRRLTVRMHRHDARFTALVRRSSDLTTIVSGSGIIGYQSPAAAPLLGRGEELVGTDFADLLHPDDVATWLGVLLHAVGNPDAEAVVEWRLAGRRGTYVDVESRVSNLLSDPSIDGIVLNSRDVTERKRLEEELRHQAFHDPLTGLANRALLRDRLEHALARHGRLRHQIGVLFVDLDDFKAVNDGRGHSAGDELLQCVAMRLHASVRAVDTVARLGGDEFAVLVEGGDPEVTSHRILDAFRQPFRLGVDDVYIHASVGVALADGTDDAGELLRNADVAMYSAKGAGKNRYEVFHPGLHDDIIRRLQLESDLPRALERREFVVHYQPILDLGSGTVLAVEALVRWQHPTHGLLAPTEFIPAAESSGHIGPMTLWLLEQACGDVLGLAQTLGLPELALKVNLSARHLEHATLADDVGAVLQLAGFPPAQLTFEITETALMADPERAVVALDRVRALGVRLAIDDFGTGYSSLSYLGRLPVDELKIDRSFVMAMSAEADAPSALVRTIIRLADELGLVTVGEGIETEDQLAQLRASGCSQGQGFLLARPVDIDQLRQLAPVA
jgi:diguanylate cyclase (GGDEF)-like protein/PAS domain S-box-containing protein